MVRPEVGTESSDLACGGLQLLAFVHHDAMPVVALVDLRIASETLICGQNDIMLCDNFFLLEL